MSKKPTINIVGPAKINLADRPAAPVGVTAEQIKKAIERFPQDRVFTSEPTTRSADDKE